MDSRAFDYINGFGHRAFADESYPYLFRRIRKCEDCGIKFITVEIRKDYMDKVSTPQMIRNEVLADIGTFLNSSNNREDTK